MVDWIRSAQDVVAMWGGALAGGGMLSPNFAAIPAAQLMAREVAPHLRRQNEMVHQSGEHEVGLGPAHASATGYEVNGHPVGGVANVGLGERGPNITARGGTWLDEDGRATNGVHFSSQFYNITNDDPGVIDADSAGVGTADFAATVNDSTARLGGQINVASVAGLLGDEEDGVRGGLSEGVGAEARLHYGDADGDNIPEIGFGMDIGPVSYDYHSETLSQGYEAVRDLGSVAGPGLVPGARERTLDRLSSIAQPVADVGREVIAAGGNLAGEAVDTGRGVVDAGVRGARGVASSARRAASDVWGWLTD